MTRGLRSLATCVAMAGLALIALESSLSGREAPPPRSPDSRGSSSPPRAPSPRPPALQREYDRLAEVIAERDPEADVPALLELLGRGDEGFRIAVTRALVQRYPARARTALTGVLADGENTARALREAAAFGLGLIDETAAAATLLDHLHRAPRRGVCGGLTLQLRRLSQRATAAVQADGAGALAHDDALRFALVRDRVCAARLSRRSPGAVTESDPYFDSLLRRVLDSRTSARLRGDFVAQLSPAEPPLAAGLAALAANTRGWLGRPDLARGATIRGTFRMVNRAAGSSAHKEIHLTLNAETTEILRSGGDRVRRGRLELASDRLVADPARCRPRLIETAEQTLTLGFDLPEGVRLELGMGTLNITYWLARVSAAGGCRLRVDRESGRPLVEELLDVHGRTAARVRFGEFAALPGGGEAPLRIAVDAPHPDTPGRHLAYEYRFQIASECWVFRDGRAWQVSEDGGRTLVAEASFTVDPKAVPPTPKKVRTGSNSH